MDLTSKYADVFHHCKSFLAFSGTVIFPSKLPLCNFSPLVHELQLENKQQGYPFIWLQTECQCCCYHTLMLSNVLTCQFCLV